MTTFDVDPALTDMMAAVFAEHGGDGDLWDRLDALGLVRLTGAEDSGGSGAGWPEAAELMSAAVRHGATHLRVGTAILGDRPSHR